MLRSDAINHLIEKNGYKKYLEIGVAGGGNYNLIKCDYKTNVDPCFDDKDGQDISQVINHMTSDDFFKITNETFDIIFIDGLHTYEQVYTDIVNSLKVLEPNGSIICHDMLPPTEWHQRQPDMFQKWEEWNGDCWKAIARLRTEEKDLKIHTINTDWGLGFIQKESNGNIPIAVSLDKVLDYSFFENNKNELMNVISIEEFLNL
jgi:hypothetical protein